MGRPMMLHQKILRLLFPNHEQDRMECREWLARANAEAENLTRTLEKVRRLNGHAFHKDNEH